VVDLTSTRYTYGDVTVNGGRGNDVLWTSAGNDTLDGGVGDDHLAGGLGNDVYVHDTGGGKVTRKGADLVLSAGANGSVTVKNWFGSTANLVERVEFTDATAWTEAQLSMRASTSSERSSGDGNTGSSSHAPGASGQQSTSDSRGQKASPNGKPQPIKDAADMVAALLDKKPRYDFRF